MSWRIKLIILIFITLFGLLLNYEKERGSFLKFFPVIEKPSLAQISLYKNKEKNHFYEKNFWGWPFAYWEKGQFNLKFLIFNLVFYLAVWLIILFVIWFIAGIKRIKERRIKPPKLGF